MVFIDPNRRDLLYCLGENPKTGREEKLRYTSSQRRKETKAKEATAKRTTILNAARLSLAGLHPPFRRSLNFFMTTATTSNPFLGQGKNAMLCTSDEYFVTALIFLCPYAKI